MTNQVLSHWEEKELIGIDSLLKGDGMVTILNCYQVAQGDEQLNYAFPLCDTTIKSLENYNDDIWTEVDIFTEKCQAANGYFVMGGEGGMGNEGFIACTDAEDQLIWALFFTHSNPFYKIESDEDIIYAYTSSSLKYQMNILAPQFINISYQEWS